MATHTLHTAASRGQAEHGWLSSRQTFSFAGYYNPERVHFGALRVLNDDVVAGGKGFGAHPHDNMEIVSIPLEGVLEHKDNMGHTKTIRQGDVQIMSTGSGVFHSEYNGDPAKAVKFLQIWLFPNKLNVTPRYDQITLNPADRHNRLQQVISPNPNDAGTWLYQDAWFYLGTFDEGFTTTYNIKKPGNGAYVFVIKGSFTVDGQTLQERDGLGIADTAAFNITANTAAAELLIMDVPLQVN
jgi:redox-sensitive bicupin YhaK (pirin superfamily)